MEWLWSSACAGCDATGAGRLCRACRAVAPHRVPAYVKGVRGAWVLGRYDSPLGTALRRAKTRHEQDLAAELAALQARRLAPLVREGGFTALVPAPSTPRALLTRGFSVAHLQAHALSRATGIPVAPVLIRRGGTRQATLDASARRANLRGRVRAEHCPAGRVLLVDDVVTTGATLDACTRELLGAGADAVWAAALCIVRRRPPITSPAPA